jgi:hypothetical protein
MFTILGNDLEAVQKAAQECGLAFLGSNYFRFHGDMKVEELPEWLSLDNLLADHVLSLLPEHAASCSRTPSEVGIFNHEGSYYAVWSSHHDGYGLNAFISHDGSRLRLTYILQALDNVLPKLGMPLETAVSVDKDENILLEIEDTMAQKKITVLVDKTGGVKIETEGFQGKTCQDATKQLEAALGTVSADTPKQEMYAPPEQHTQING